MLNKYFNAILKKIKPGKWIGGTIPYFMGKDGGVLTKENFSEYLLRNKIDTKFPLVSNYNGTMVNVSFQSVDEKEKLVNLYAPVFQGVKYKLAKPVADYVKEFEDKTISANVNPIFSCNCILNYLYSELEGKKTGNYQGPITFGEIAYQLLNQTMTYLEIV
ncbi:MAG: hypothetical protein KAR07_11800 [Spirochaetes bacterium]|nr:hypothetical protein [Spirochaetota bacterium]